MTFDIKKYILERVDEEILINTKQINDSFVTEHFNVSGFDIEIDKGKRELELHYAVQDTSTLTEVIDIFKNLQEEGYEEFKLSYGWDCCDWYAYKPIRGLATPKERRDLLKEVCRELKQQFINERKEYDTYLELKQKFEGGDV